MYDGPSFTKPTHGYGQLPENDPQTDAELAGLFTEGPVFPDEDENWAGPDFVKPYEEPHAES